MATFFRNTVASPGTFGCRGSFIDLLRLLIRPTTACGSPSPPAFHDFVHQRGERASPSCTGRESRARSARSDRFYGGKARDLFFRVFFWPALPVPYLLNFFSKLSDSTDPILFFDFVSFGRHFCCCFLSEFSFFVKTWQRAPFGSHSSSICSNACLLFYCVRFFFTFCSPPFFVAPIRCERIILSLLCLRLQLFFWDIAGLKWY